MAKLTPDATRTEYGLVINQKIIPWGAVWPKDSGKYTKGQGDKTLSVDIDLMIVGGIVEDGVEPV